ncbi:Phospholipase D1 [Friedmanniomyces endolithicus]|nr:Phospholipase D1 [Friedmanniomyces endolithicus]
MATATTAKPYAAGAREESVSPMSRAPRGVSPSTTLYTQEEEMLAKTNGYVSSPLRVQQRLASLDGKKLPDLPSGRPEGNGWAKAMTGAGPETGKAASVHWDTAAPNGSFPFEAQPGASGPEPTNELLKTNGKAEPALIELSRKRANGSSPATPSHRRSVQFARGMTDEDVASSPLQKTQTWESEVDGDHGPNTKERDRQSSFFGKLKALTSTTPSSHHTRGPSSSTGFATPMGALSPQSERSEPMYPLGPSEAADADIEEEDSERDQIDELRPKKRRVQKRPATFGTDSGPSTPKQSRFASFRREQAVPSSSNRPANPDRRNTLSDMPESENPNAGVSEDEGRDRIRSAWRRGLEGARGLSYAARRHEDVETPVGGAHRPGALRRITGMGGHDGTGASPFRIKADRQASSSAQKWRQVKSAMKVMTQRKKDERMMVDHQKSAQLMAELLAGAPAALVFASMYQRDEHGHRKVPVLLEQLKIRIPHSEMKKDNAGDRHLLFKVDLEYGSGAARMVWTIRRTLQDFVNLHWKYKGQSAADRFRRGDTGKNKQVKMPKFPKSAFPYARGARGLFEKLIDEDEAEDVTQDNIEGVPGGEGSGTDTAPQRPTLSGPKHTRRKSSFAPPRRTSTGELIPPNTDPNSLNAFQREKYNEHQRKKLERYLQQMIRWLIFRADSTRLCKFLELSALAIRLSAEGGFQGKQGLLTIASRRHRELRHKGLTLTKGGGGFAERHHARWFLVRHSYIVCVDGPESLIPYDVFLVDADFRMEKKAKKITEQKTAAEMAKAAVDTTKSGKNHLIRLYNSERKLKLIAKSERQFVQFQESLVTMTNETVWSRKQRFNSYAPVRNNVWARWLVDGRDHMWQVSRAIDNAKDFIYIHDWWLSPELYMRRPAAISQKWRLDRLLKRKAEEGVKIFVIVYRNIESAVPIDSEYTKWALLDLHENICVQRSPNQFRQNQFFWAHHEKLVVVDNMMAFVGGVDLCFGRWDDPCHSLTDDKLTGFEVDLPGDVPRDSEHCQVWPGKDYSNPRVQDFYALDRPYEEMYDRTKVPRMPWHDIAMQVVGQPARDVGRHFVQRWNYVLRNRVPTRPTPVLLPPPEYESEELARLGLSGTCQVQILRSCSSWSMGTPNKVEHSIMDAYCHLIRTSEHFVYVENQFFISSCTVEGTPIHNQIGNAIVERAVRAAENGEKWQACLVIPLMPGFQNSVDAQDGTSIRLIMQCQYRSICRGESSIFGKLRAKGIDPEQYVRFYSLRQWGRIGPRKCLTTEQLYIHAKCMVVDDRTAIIGSANINERSMLGSRDSEVAAVVTDTKMVASFMGGEPYEVGEFAHGLRVRLMREHLGIDVDAVYRREVVRKEREVQDEEMGRIYRDEAAGRKVGRPGGVGEEAGDYFGAPMQTAQSKQTDLHSFVHGKRGRKKERRDSSSSSGTSGEDAVPQDPMERVKAETKKEAQRDLDVDGYGTDNMKALVDAGDIGLTDTFTDRQGREVLLKTNAPDGKAIRKMEEELHARSRSASRERKVELPIRPPWPTERLDTVQAGLLPRSQLPELPALDDTDIGGPALTRGMSQSSSTAKLLNPLIASMRRPDITEDCMVDPLASGFYQEIWHAVAENNTKLYRQVFRCMPDSEVPDWKAYERFNDYSERFRQSQGLGASQTTAPKEAPEQSGPPGTGSTGSTVLSGSAVKEVLQGGPEGKAKSKRLFGAALNKLRPGSRGGEEAQSHVEALREKEGRVEHPPGSPSGSGLSTGQTVVPSPQPGDEKDGIATIAATTKYGGGEGIAPDDRTGMPLSSSSLHQQPKVEDAGETSFERKRTVQYSDSVNLAPEMTATTQHSGSNAGFLQHSASQTKQRKRRGTAGRSVGAMEEVLGREEAEDLMGLVQGTVVLWPYDWLEREERGGNWLYNIDQLAPLEIYD